jgi:lysophospholipase L1-like esterase
MLDSPMHSIEWYRAVGCWVVLLAAQTGCNRATSLFGAPPAASVSPVATALSSSAAPSTVAVASVAEANPRPELLPEAHPASEDEEQRLQAMAGSRRAVPLPLMVMPLGANSAGTSVRGKALLPPDEFDDAPPTAPLGSAPLLIGRDLQQEPVRPQVAKSYPQNVADRPVPRLGSQPWMISDEWESRHNSQLKAANREQAMVVFLGDSITDAWRMSPSYKQHFSAYAPLNLGISGEYTQNLLWRIEHGALDGLSPKAVVIMIGVNNLGGGFTPQQTAKGVRAVLSAVQGRLPGVPILLLSILPAGESPDATLRKKITEANELIAKMQFPGVAVVDIGSVLLEPDGTIAKSVLRDFLHPTEAGYVRLGDALAPRLQQIVQQG